MTRLLLVDDQDLARQGLRPILELAGLEVVGEARDDGAAVEAVTEHAPDVVLMDLRMPGMPGMDGVEATRRITEAGGYARVLAPTTFDADEHVVDARAPHLRQARPARPRPGGVGRPGRRSQLRKIGLVSATMVPVADPV